MNRQETVALCLAALAAIATARADWHAAARYPGGSSTVPLQTEWVIERTARHDHDTLLAAVQSNLGAATADTELAPGRAIAGSG